MKSKIAPILLFAVAAQAQFIGDYHSYPLPAAIPVQHGQFVPSNIYAYPVQPSYYYRDIAGNNIGSLAYFKPTVQDEANAADASVNSKSAAARMKRQIQLRYRGGGRNGRSLNDRSLAEHTAHTVATQTRKARQIQLRYRGASSRRGRSVNKLRSFHALEKFGATPSRNDRQIQLRYRSSARRRIGRSLNHPTFIGTMPSH